MSNQPFVPIGLPRNAKDGDTTDQRVGLHLLEALDALDAVYKTAAWFAKVDEESAIGDYALQRCLEAVGTDTGALFLVDDSGLTLAADRNGATSRIRTEELSTPDLMARACLLNGIDAARILASGAVEGSVLTSPIHVGNRLAGMVVMMAAVDDPFSTADAKLIAGIASQAAIALGRARNLRVVETERQKLQLVVHSHPEGIAMLDQHGTTTVCNPIARELLDTGEVFERLQALDPSLTLATLFAGPTERELTIAGPHGQRVVGVESHPCGVDSGRSLMVTVRDLTRVRREERLKRNFVSLISHKLRTPLTSLLCALEMTTGASPEDQRVFLGEMNERARDLGGLIDRLFQFTELLEGSWTARGTCDLRRTCQDLHAHYGQQAGARGVELVHDLAADAIDVPIPGPRLRVALQNLIDNAIKFTPGERPWVRIASRRDGDTLVLEVEDRGPGIPHSEQAAVLGAFHQLDSDFTGNMPGAGIGLAMVREIVRRMDGRLDLRDAVPHGCIFALTLPLAAAGNP
jgi:signal transduction histidine kinase